ncbi:MAG TPA: RagB/SusD family nutrient uptake outer membrane protein, partial [Bacteroidales bacterium]|nr:RagB/SusD family nutrient uptake outer membrane protein [Bacteroidales bacterium]
MNIRYKIASILAMVIMLGFSSCTEDLNTEPLDDDVVTSASVYEDAEGYQQVLGKCYAGLSLTGQQGPAGMPDIQGIDEGFSSYLRTMWTHQELSTDEAVVAWSDPGLPNFNYNNWSASNGWVKAMYNRIFYQITLCNEFIRESSDGKLSERGISGSDADAVRTYRSEVRFLRAFSYWHAIDMFGNIPFVTEEDNVGAFQPPQRSRAEVFDYIESELLDVLENGSLKDPKQNEYGRIDKAAAWMLLTKLYLNAEVYKGEPMYAEAMDYAERVINSAYQLDPNYEELFLADNHTADGIIFPVVFDGNNSQTYGGMNFLIHAAVGGSMSANDFGIDGGWAGIRVTPQLYNTFDDPANDSRAMFHTDGQELEIPDVTEFTNGYAVAKFKNITSEGNAGSVPGFVDTDWPVFRLADAYLMYAEAALRSNTGNLGTARDYVNEVRERAYGNDSENITQG